MKKGRKEKKIFTIQLRYIAGGGILLLTAILVLKIFIDSRIESHQINQSVALLDDAEAKMRQINILKTDRTTYDRSCSVGGSQFFESPGPRNCRITRYDVFLRKSTADAAKIAQNYVVGIPKQFPGSSVENSAQNEPTEDFSSTGGYKESVNHLKLQDGLQCYQKYTLTSDHTVNWFDTVQASESPTSLAVLTSCFKSFPRPIYPER